MEEFLENLLIQNEPKLIVKVTNFENEPALKKGENFMSTIFRYKVTVQLTNGKTIFKNLIVKTLPDEKDHTTFLREFSFFKNEITAYSTLLFNMKKLMEEFKDKRETLWSELIGFKPYNIVVLQDLKELHYKPMKRRENLDYNHSVYMIKSLARFHAMSATLLNREIVNGDEFEPYQFAKKRILKLFFWACMSVMEKAVREYWGEQWECLADVLKKASEQLENKVLELVKIDTKRFNIVNHGDSWTNNLLFKHEEGTNIPCGVKIVDYQITHYNSFAWDVTYFFYTSILPEIRRANYMEFLRMYHKELCENLHYFQYPKQKIPTLQHIIDEMDRIKFFGFVLMASIYPWTSSETDNPYDVEMALNDIESPDKGVNIEIFTCEKYRSLVEKDLLEFVKEGIIA